MSKTGAGVWSGRLRGWRWHISRLSLRMDTFTCRARCGGGEGWRAPGWGVVRTHGGVGAPPMRPNRLRARTKYIAPIKIQRAEEVA
jgi:hypothetical protein